MDTVTHSEFGEDAGDVGLDGRLGQVEVAGELGIAEALGQQAQDVELTGGQRGQVAVNRCGVGVVAGEPFDEAAGDRRRKERVAGADQPDSGDQVLGSDVFEPEPAGPGGQRRVDVVVEVERGQDDHAWFMGGGTGQDGVHKALGMTPRQTITMVIASVVVTGLIGGAIGAPIGVVLQKMILSEMASVTGFNLPGSVVNIYHPAELALFGLRGLLIAILGALLPAGWAARTRTATALRTE